MSNAICAKILVSACVFDLDRSVKFRKNSKMISK